MKSFFLALILCFTVLFANAQEVNKVAKKPFKNSFLPAPIISYSPETSLILGAFFMSNYKIEKKEEDTRASNTIISGYYSFRNQAVIYMKNNLFTKHEGWYLGGYYEFKKWPERYFGLGAFSKDSSIQIISYSLLNFNQPILFKITTKHFIGASFKYSIVWDVKSQKGISELSGTKGGDYLGTGFMYVHDNRNDLVTSTKGHYFSFLNHYFVKGYLSKTSFSNIIVDYRKFITLKGLRQKVLAFQTKYCAVLGKEIPFQELNRLGGENIMRGLLEGRYRDKCSWQIQSEFRMHLYQRIGITSFIAAGNVMNHPSSINITTTKYAGGMGLRYKIFKNGTSNIRLDYGVSNFGSGVYATFGEAF